MSPQDKKAFAFELLQRQLRVNGAFLRIRMLWPYYTSAKRHGIPKDVTDYGAVVLLEQRDQHSHVLTSIELAQFSADTQEDAVMSCLHWIDAHGWGKDFMAALPDGTLPEKE